MCCTYLACPSTHHCYTELCDLPICKKKRSRSLSFNFFFTLGCTTASMHLNENSKWDLWSSSISRISFVTGTCEFFQWDAFSLKDKCFHWSYSCPMCLLLWSPLTTVHKKKKTCISKERTAGKWAWVATMVQGPHCRLFVWLLLGWLAFSSGKGPNDWKRQCAGKISASSNCSPHLVWISPKQTTKDGGQGTRWGDGLKETDKEKQGRRKRKTEKMASRCAARDVEGWHLYIQ